MGEFLQIFLIILNKVVLLMNYFVKHLELRFVRLISCTMKGNDTNGGSGIRTMNDN
jgi:hypothetical protein